MKHTSRAIVLCDRRKCRRWIRDAETLRLIVKHKLAMVYYSGTGWAVEIRGSRGKAVDSLSIHTAVRKAAKGAP